MAWRADVRAVGICLRVCVDERALGGAHVAGDSRRVESCGADAGCAYCVDADAHGLWLAHVGAAFG